jgi:MFS family permease
MVPLGPAIRTVFSAVPRHAPKRTRRTVDFFKAALQRFNNDLVAVLQVRDYRLYASSRVAAGVAQAMLQAVILWQVYALTSSALDLGLVGLMRFLPALGLSLVSGVVVDTFNRRTVLLCAQLVPLVLSVAMLAALLANSVSLAFLYAFVFVIGMASAFEGPARQTLIPLLVPRRLYPRAITVNSTLQSLASVTGPALGGVLIAAIGVTQAYAVYGLLVLASIVLLLPLRISHSTATSRAGLRAGAVRDGFVFLRHRPLLLGVMTLDMFAVIFGGAKALLPIYAVDILRADASGYGVLTA